MSATWEVGSGTATYKNEDNILFTVSGIKTEGLTSGDTITGLALNEKEVTVSKSLLPESGTVSISGEDYTLKLDDDVPESTTSNELSELDDNTVKVQSVETAGWKETTNGKTFTYTEGYTEPLATITGVHSKDGLTLEGTKVKVSESAFNASGGTISIEKEFGASQTFTLEANFAAEIKTAPTTGDVELKKDTATTNHTATVEQVTSAYYQTGSNSIQYIPAVTATLATITGLQTEDISLSGTTVNVTKTDAIGKAEDAAVTLKNAQGQIYSLGFTADGVTNNKVGLAENAAAWTDGGVYKSSYKSEGWELDSESNTISYKAAETPTEITSISGSGLKGTTASDLAGATVDTTAKTITLDSSSLKGSLSANDKVTATNDYKLVVDENLQFDYNPASQTPTVTVSDTTGTVSRTQTEGWSGSNTATLTYTAEGTKNLATITGLKTGATEITVSETTVTLPTTALGNTEVKIEDKNSADEIATDKGFTLTLASGVNTSATKDAETVTTTVTNGTATITTDYAEYWTLGKGGKSVTYTAKNTATDAVVATVEGLKSTATASDIDVTRNGAIKLKKAALDTSEITLTDTNSAGYSLAFDDDVTAKDTAPVLNTVTLTISDTTATVNKDLGEYWTISGSKVEYHEAVAGGNSTAEATITNLGSGASKDTVKLNGTVITLEKAALPTGSDETKTGFTGSGYTLTFGSGIYTEAKDNVDSSHVATVTGGTATINYDRQEYWSLGDNYTTVTYHAATEGTGTTVATVNGLKNAASKSEVTVEGKVIKLKQAALATDTAAEIDNTGKNNSYTLAFDGTVDEPNKPKSGVDPTLTVNGTTATVKQELTEGWVLESGNTQVAYYDPDDKLLATVSNIKSGITSGTQIKLGGTDETKTTITLEAGALDAKNVTLKNEEGSEYKLALAGGITEPDNKPLNLEFDFTDLTNGNVKVQGKTTAGYTKTSDELITYTKQETVDVVTLTGLNPNLIRTRDIQIVDADGTSPTIKVTKNALTEDATKPAKLTNNQTDYYNFKFDSTSVQTPALQIVAGSVALGDVKDGTAKILGTKSAGWTNNDASNQITYTAPETNAVVATVTGLKNGAVSGTDFEFNAGLGKFTVKESALTNSSITLTPADANYASNFTLLLDGKSTGQTVGGDAIGYWTKKGTTANYYSTNAESWTYTDTKNITYAPMDTEAATLKATINGLSRDITYGAFVTEADGTKRYLSIGTGQYTTGADSTFVAGVSVANNNTITLNRNVLGTTDADGKAVTMDYTLADGYSIALNDTDSDNPSDTASGYVRQAAANLKFWELGATATYKQADLEYWTHDTSNKKITYTPRGTETVLATITGLNENITKDDLTVADSAGAGIKIAITLNKKALAERDVNITSSGYKLAVNSNSADDGYVAPSTFVTDTNKWELNNAKTIATYKADVEAGYEAASDGSSIIYTAAATDKTIAKVEGLNGNSDLEISSDKQSIGIDDNGTYTEALSFGTAANGKKPITLTKDVLGTSNVKVTGTNYTLAVTEDKNNGIYLSDSTEITNGVDVWRVDGTTATYKKVKYANYKIEDGATEITYVPEADATTKQTVGGVEKDVPVVHATVEGLKSGLTVADGGQSLNDGTTTEVVKLNGASGKEKQIDLKSAALGTSGIEVKGEGYTLSLGETATAEALKPKQNGALTWAVTATNATDGTTAEIKGVLDAGYELVITGEKANKQIKYTEKDPNHTFATITGLKSDITSADLNASSGGVSLGTKILTLTKDFLGDKNVVIDKDGIANGFTFALDGGVATTAADIKVWDFDAGTAKYMSKKEAFYAKATATDSTTADTQITYTGRTAGTQLAAIAGLKSNLKVENDQIAGITPDNAGNPTTFTISADVLDKKEATITPGTYTFRLADEAAPSQTGEFFWTLSGTTASYQFNSIAGYTLKDNKISYQDAKSGKNANTVVEISGLKSGVKKADVESNIDVSGGTFKLYKPVLGTTEIKLTPKDAAVSGTTYALALDSDPTIAKDTGKVGWAKNADNSYTLKQYTPEHWELDSTDTSNQTVKYTAGALGTAIATVTGLKTNLTVQPEATSAQINGIEVDSTTNHTITLSKGVLTTVAATPAKITMADGYTGTDYKFAIADTDVPAPAYSKKWTASRGTATLTETITLGYTGDGTDTITYQPKKTVTTTISGLKNTVAPKTGNLKIEGITLKDSTGAEITNYATDTDITDGTFHVASSLLADKTVTLTNKSGGGTYELFLDDITEVNPDDAKWYKADGATTATYETRVATGYVKEEGNTKYTYYNSDDSTVTTLATLKGLTKTVTAAKLNAVIGDPSAYTPAVAADPDNNVEAQAAKPGVFTIKSANFGNLELSDIFGKNKLTLTSTDYELAFDTPTNFHVADIKNEDAVWTYNSKKGTAELVAGKTEGWAFKETTKKGVTTTDYKTIVYTKAAPKTIAAISGLQTGLELSADGKSLTYIDEETGEKQTSLTFKFASGKTDHVGKTDLSAKAEILVGAGVLTDKTVTVTPKQTGYTFEFKTDTDVFEPKDGEGYWRVNNKGTAFYRYDTSEGYKLGKKKTDNDQLIYSKEFYTPLATVSGLDKNKVKETAEGVKLAQIDGITVSSEPKPDDPLTTTTNEAENGVITLWDDSILTNKVTISGKYDLAVAPEIAVVEGTVENKQSKWYFKNGTATYQLYNTAGYAVNAKKTIVEKNNETAGTTLVTLKGLKKTLAGTTATKTAADLINENNYLIVNDDNTITISDAIKNDTTITLTDGIKTKGNKTTPAEYYQYTIDPNNSFTAPAAQDPFWSFNKGTATLKQTTLKGYTLTDTLLKKSTQVIGQKLTFAKETTPTVATIKNLATDLVILTKDEAKAINDARGTGTVTAGKVYSKTTTGDPATTTYIEVLKYDADQKIVTVSKDALLAKNATISGKYDYKLALDAEVVNKAENVTEWVVSGTNANYKNYDQAYHTLNDAKTAINYVKPKDITTYATVKGIASGSTIAAGDWSGTKDGGTLTLKAENLGVKTISITSNVANQNAFTLALATDAATTAKVSTLTPGSWTNNGKGTVTLKGTLGVGFTQEFGGKTLTYNKTNNKSVTIATVTGLANNATISAGANGVITLNKDLLAQKNVAVTTSMGPINYTLSYASASAPGKNVDSTYTGDTSKPDAGRPLNPKNKKPGWTISSTTGTLKGYVTSEGYTMSNSATTLTYTGKTQVNTTTDKKSKAVTAYTYKDTTTLATIKGLKTTADKENLIVSDKIKLNSGNTNGNLTINAGTYAVEVDNTYNSKSITGSAGADNITVAGDKLTVTGGKGDDYIDLGAATNGNTFVYSNGDGNDVIANFTPGTDKLQIKSGTPLVAKSTNGNDFIVKVGTGSITLTDAATSANSLTILNNKNVATTYSSIPTLPSSGSNVLLADDNYNMDAASLSDLVKGDSASYNPYDFDTNFSLTKEDKLTPQISYSGNEKK